MWSNGFHYGIFIHICHFTFYTLFLLIPLPALSPSSPSLVDPLSSFQVVSFVLLCHMCGYTFYEGILLLFFFSSPLLPLSSSLLDSLGTYVWVSAGPGHVLHTLLPSGACSQDIVTKTVSFLLYILSMIMFFVRFIYLLFFFKTRSPYVALAILEVAMYTKLASDS